ncbi:MAG: MAPEG family protein [Myxococcota bacterium]
MNPTLISLCLFAGWTLLLVFVLANLRVVLSITSEKAINSFLPDGTDLDGFGRRLTRAHLNCLEFLPVFGAVALAAFVSGQLSVTDPLAMVVLYARLAQSTVHMISVAAPAVLARASLFFIQLAIAVYWIFQLLTG